MSAASAGGAVGAGPIAAGGRVLVVDVLRGFALLGILVVNMAAFRAPFFGQAGDLGLDRVATFVIAFGFEQKLYVLFSFLFGYGLFVQMDRADRRGVPFVPRYLRRLLGLFLIGPAHAILVTYALLGVIRLLVRNAPSGVLLGVAAGLVMLTAAMFLFGGTVLARSSRPAGRGPRRRPGWWPSPSAASRPTGARRRR